MDGLSGVRDFDKGAAKVRHRSERHDRRVAPTGDWKVKEDSKYGKNWISGIGRDGHADGQPFDRAGHDVTVWNRTAERTAALAQGAAVARSPAAAAAGATSSSRCSPRRRRSSRCCSGPRGWPCALSWPDRDRHVDRGAGRGPLGCRSHAGAVHHSLTHPFEAVCPRPPPADSTYSSVRPIDDYERVRPILQSLGSVRRTGAWDRERP